MSIRNSSISRFPEGSRILVVEDEPLLATFLTGILRAAGADVVGPAPQIDSALALMEDETGLDAALLDVNLGRVPVFPVADELVRRSIPFIFATGYGQDGLPEAYRNFPIVRKPYTRKTILEALDSLDQATIRT